MIETLFQKNLWVGKGLLGLSMLEDPLSVWLNLKVSKKDSNEEDERMQWFAEYQVLGYSQPIINRYTFSTIIKNHFSISLENELWGKAEGLGFIDAKSISMEFPRGPHGFEGFESITFENETTIQWIGEFLTSEGLRSVFNMRVMKCEKKSVIEALS
ncbi:MAG: hypothetical protein JSR76_07520 [Verrucomicrobia bacterium]|nr:hypothetical protein [Verrucomicrobiota bacterium]